MFADLITDDTKEDTVDESTGFIARIRANIKKIAIGIVVVIGGITIGISQIDKDITIIYQVYSSFPSDTVWTIIQNEVTVKDSVRLVFIMDSLNAESKKQFCTDVKSYSSVQYQTVNGKLCASKGEFSTIKQYDSVSAKLIDVKVPAYDTLITDKTSDSAEIIFVKPNSWKVIAKKDMNYSAPFSPEYARAFYVSDFITDADGNKRPAMDMIDYKTCTYSVPMDDGDTLDDPGYATVPSLIGPSPKYASGDSTRPSSHDTSGLLHLYTLNADTSAGGITGDSSGSAVAVSGTFQNSAVDSIGAKYGNGCMILPDAATGNNRLRVADKTSLNGATRWTFSAWVMIKDTATQQIIFDNRASSTVFISIQYLNTKSFSCQIRDAGASAFSNVSAVLPGTTVRDKWIHLSVVKDSTGVAAGNIVFYVNGINYATTASGTFFNSVATLDTMFFGNYSVANLPLITSRMDNIQLYNKKKIRTTINTLAIAGRESWKKPDTTAGIVYVDTALASVDTVCMWNATVASHSVRLPVVAGGLYNITPCFTLDTALSDTTVDTVAISQGLQIINRRVLTSSSRDTIRSAAANNIGQGDSTEYVLDFNKAVSDTFLIDTVFIPKISMNYNAQSTVYLAFENVSGDNTYDSTANQRDAVAASTGTFATGKYGNGYVLDGTNSYLQVSQKGISNDSVSANQREFTLLLWVKPDTCLPTEVLWSENSADWYWQNTIACGKWYTRDSSTGTTGARNNDLTLVTPPLHQWTHLAFVYSVSGGYKKQYFNGRDTATSTTSIDKFTASRWADEPRIGYDAIDGSSTKFDGTIDEVMVFHKALTQAEIILAMNNKYKGVIPDSGTAAGGTSVSIYGISFKATQTTGTVTFGGTAAASYTSWADGKIVLVTPPYAPIQVNIILTNSDAQKDTAIYTYILVDAVKNTFTPYGFTYGFTGGFTKGFKK